LADRRAFHEQALLNHARDLGADFGHGKGIGAAGQFDQQRHRLFLHHRIANIGRRHLLLLRTIAGRQNEAHRQGRQNKTRHQSPK
jgi:hypothetical protein